MARVKPSKFSDVDQVQYACDWLSAMLVIASNYNYYDLGQLRPSARNPILENLMWDSLVIQAVSCLDHILRFCGTEGSDFCQRIDNSKIGPDLKMDLHALRDYRNSVGHEPANINQSPDEAYKVAKGAVMLTREVSQSLSLIQDASAKFEFYAERGQGYNSEKPGVMVTFDLFFAVKKEGKMFVQNGWNSSIMLRNEPDPEGQI